MVKNKYSLYVIALLLLLGACDKKQDQNSDTASLGEGEIEITAEHFANGAMEIGTLTMQPFAEEVTCRGYLTAPADAQAKVTTSVAGAVQTVQFKIGDYVKRGQTLCTISGSDFLSLQQQYAESSALYRKAEADYERMKMLQEERIGAKKDYLSAESIYKTSMAGYNALKARIRAINIDPEKIERGEMYTAFPVVAPISGYITASEAIIGQYIDVAYVIAHIVDTDKLQLQLSVFDRDIDRLAVGQEVYFSLSGKPDQVMTAKLISVGRAINPETKTIDCIAQLNEKDKQRLVSDTFVQAHVVVNREESAGLPASAIQKEGNDYFSYIVERELGDSYIVIRQPIEVGRTYKDYVEVTGGLEEGTRVLLKGIETL
ncbi:MAG: efflux RND transporter periplasmic adaptor subunit [Porphyromonas sp.]|nr:efflux RND transporter periplasmic adaptor subunit [Porphyromonas sp.]